MTMISANKFISIILFSFVIIFVQSSFIKIISNQYTPNLFLLFVIYLAFYDSSKASVYLSFILGLIYDFYTAVLVGPWAGTFLIVLFFIKLINKRMFLDSALILIVISFFLSIIANTYYYLISADLYSFKDGIFKIIFYGSFLTAIISPLVLGIYELIFGIKKRHLANLNQH